MQRGQVLGEACQTWLEALTGTMDILRLWVGITLVLMNGGVNDMHGLLATVVFDLVVCLWRTCTALIAHTV